MLVHLPPSLLSMAVDLEEEYRVLVRLTSSLPLRGVNVQGRSSALVHHRCTVEGCRCCRRSSGRVHQLPIGGWLWHSVILEGRVM